MNSTMVIDLSAAEQLDCPEFSTDVEHMVDSFSYWCEGVLLCALAIFGIVGNSISGVILAAKSMRNSFNLLLIALAVYDNTYLVGAVLESFRKRFNLSSDLHIYLFPYFLYPLHMVAMTGSILMTVAIALERFVAVHYPVNYSQSMNDAGAVRRRVAKYLVPVGVLSLAMNVTKFFEIEIGYEDVVDEYDNSTRVRPVLNITEFRMDPTYSIYFNWFRFISIGVIPFLLLVFFNTHIYLDIRKRRDRKQRSSSSNNHLAMSEQRSMVLRVHRSMSEQGHQVDTNVTNCDEGNNVKAEDNNKELKPLIKPTGPKSGGSTPRGEAAAAAGRGMSATAKSVASANDARRRMESNLAAIMMGYVLVFLICHLPRLMLNIHELANIRKGLFPNLKHDKF